MDDTHAMGQGVSGGIGSPWPCMGSMPHQGGIIFLASKATILWIGVKELATNCVPNSTEK